MRNRWGKIGSCGCVLNFFVWINNTCYLWHDENTETVRLFLKCQQNLYHIWYLILHFSPAYDCLASGETLQSVARAGKDVLRSALLHVWLVELLCEGYSKGHSTNRANGRKENHGYMALALAYCFVWMLHGRRSRSTAFIVNWYLNSSLHAPSDTENMESALNHWYPLFCYPFACSPLKHLYLSLPVFLQPFFFYFFTVFLALNLGNTNPT